MSVYTEVTQAIIAELERGTPPWVKSWQSHLPQNFIPKKEYRGCNVLLLWAKAMEKGYTSPYWLTFKQAGDCDGKIKKGEKATWIYFASKKVKEDEETGEEKAYFFLKWYHVFNLEQTDGIGYEKPEDKRPSLIIEEAESFLASLGAKVILGGAKAFYRPATDEIHLPAPRDFNSIANYYAASLHEHVHWTAHPSRLDRPLINRYGTEEYAKEELVAELGAAFLCSHLQIPTRLREDHAAYIKGWIQVLREDKRAIFKASALATKAADYLRERADAFDLKRAPAPPAGTTPPGWQDGSGGEEDRSPSCTAEGTLSLIERGLI